MVATTAPSTPGIITPYFQRAGDNWSGRGRFDRIAGMRRLQPRHSRLERIRSWYRLRVIGLRSRPPAQLQTLKGFREAVKDTGEVGFVLGGGDGYGHGVHATVRASNNYGLSGRVTAGRLRFGELGLER